MDKRAYEKHVLSCLKLSDERHYSGSPCAENFSIESRNAEVLPKAFTIRFLKHLHYKLLWSGGFVDVTLVYGQKGSEKARLIQRISRK